MKKKILIGIDEVGRGCLAGPVVVCALAIEGDLPWSFTPQHFQNDYSQKSLVIKDSKKMTEPQRYALLENLGLLSKIRKLCDLKKTDLCVSASYEITSDCSIKGSLPDTLSDFRLRANLEVVSATDIAQKNILYATLDGMWRGCQRHLTHQNHFDAEFEIVIDGPYNFSFYQQKRPHYLSFDETELIKNYPGLALVKGEDRSSAIALASIIAKTFRDLWMENAAKFYPHYGFDRHVGYATKVHQKVIRERGMIEGVHRPGFCQKFLTT
jgi:ribonuclease HII